MIKKRCENCCWYFHDSYEDVDFCAHYNSKYLCDVAEKDFVCENWYEDRTMADKTEKRCGTCKWHKMEEGDGDGVCANKLSDFFIDRTDDDFKCEKWEALKNA